MSRLVEVTDEDIAMQRRGDPSASAIALALARALNVESVTLRRGPATTPILDVRVVADPTDSTRWYAVIGEKDMLLPPHAQYFLSALDYGPKSGPFAIRDKKGRVIRMMTFCEIMTPFSFTLDIPE